MATSILPVQAVDWPRMAYHRTSCSNLRRRHNVSGFKGRQKSNKDQVLDSSSSDSDGDKDNKDGSSSNKNFGPSFNSNSNGNDNSNGSGNGNGNSNGGNSNNNGSGPGSNKSNNSPPSPPPGSPPPGSPPPGSGPSPARVGCQFVNENDGRLQYTGLWTLEAKDPTGFTTTTHTTFSAGSQVSVNFNGSMVIVVGIVHPSNSTVPPATAAYTIDTTPPTELPLPVATHDIPNQQFFQSVELTPGEHTLLINVTSDGSPYTLDYLFVCGSGGPPSQAPTETRDPPQQTFVSKKVAAIAGGILGSLMLMLLVALVYVLWFSKRRRSRSGRTTNSPLREWLQRQTLFTSSDSIMRNNPTNSSAVGHKDVTSDPPDALSERKSESKSMQDIPVYRTFAEFDNGFNFPISYRLSTQLSAQVPCSPNATDGRHDLSPHPALPSSPLKSIPF